MRLARTGGVPVPEVLDVDGLDLVLERVNGPTMLADLAHTYLLLVSSTIPGGLRQRAIGRIGQSAFAGLYRAAAGPAAVDGELIAVARRRLVDPTLRPEEAARIRRLLSLPQIGCYAV